MELYVFNSSRKLIGIVEAYEYLKWTRKYYSCGSFELKAIADSNNLELLRLGNIIYKNDGDEAGIIELFSVSQRESEIITVSGRFLTSALSKRIIWNTEILKCDLGEALGRLINDNLINPSDPDRVEPNIYYHNSYFGISVNSQISYKNLMDAVFNLCEASDVGLKTVFNHSDGSFNIIPYVGADTLAVFSREFENVIEQSYTKSVANYANVALVAGEGEGEERIKVTVGAASGEERYELYVDAKDLRVEDFPDNYNEALIYRGASKLSEMDITNAFESTVNQYGNLKYKTDFDLGSKVKCVSQRWGVTLSARITEISERFGSNGMTIDCVFGKPLLTLEEKLKEAIE